MFYADLQNQLLIQEMKKIRLQYTFLKHEEIPCVPPF